MDREEFKKIPVSKNKIVNVEAELLREFSNWLLSEAKIALGSLI